jgi:hypothetical protein
MPSSISTVNKDDNARAAMRGAAVVFMAGSVG